MNITQALDYIDQHHADIVQRYQAGEAKLYGFFIGKAMRLLNGQADVYVLNQMCAARWGIVE